MKGIKKIFIMLVVADCFLTFCGCSEDNSSKSSISSSNSSVRPSQSYVISKHDVEEMRRKINNLNSQNSQLEGEKIKLENELDETRSIAKSRHTILSIIFFIALGIIVLIIGGFAFIARATKRAPAKMSNDSLHCPRCGWEHRPEETICKNCKTHF